MHQLLWGGYEMRFWIKKENDREPIKSWETSYILTINRDSGSTMFSSLPSIWYHLDQQVISPVYEDLFIIGMSIFALDKRVSRREFSDCWTREIEVSIPVLEIQKWLPTVEKLNALLSFLTGDVWNIKFRQTDAVCSKHKKKNRKRIDVSKCDCVSLFSGGLDSYCGAIKLLAKGKSPVLIGHNEYPKLRYIQEKFCHDFQECYSEQSSVFIGFTAGARAPVTQNGSALTQTENTSRGRSLLFLCAAVSIAGILGEETPIYIPENGFIGLNVALTNSRKGSCSTRTTHPAFLKEFSEILQLIGIRNQIYNFFAFNTKREIVQMVTNTEVFKRGYAETISCAHPCLARYNKNGSREYPINCGYCYPCLIRKSSLQDVESDGKYSSKLMPSTFLETVLESERSDDLYAILNSIYRFKNSSSKDIRRLIWCTGKLTSDEISKYERVYISGMNDLIELLSSDPGMLKYM